MEELSFGQLLLDEVRRMDGDVDPNERALPLPYQETIPDEQIPPDGVSSPLTESGDTGETETDVEITDVAAPPVSEAKLLDDELAPFTTYFVEAVIKKFGGDKPEDVADTLEHALTKKKSSFTRAVGVIGLAGGLAGSIFVLAGGPALIGGNGIPQTTPKRSKIHSHKFHNRRQFHEVGNTGARLTHEQTTVRTVREAISSKRTISRSLSPHKVQLNQSAEPVVRHPNQTTTSGKVDTVIHPGLTGGAEVIPKRNTGGTAFGTSPPAAVHFSGGAAANSMNTQPLTSASADPHIRVTGGSAAG